jgi:hypothetical protein
VLKGIYIIYLGNAQVKAACILVDFIGSSIQLFHRYHLHVIVLAEPRAVRK